jgi:hypothetical protein
MLPANRRPITDVPFTEVLVRVAYQLVVLDHRRNKPLYGTFPAKRIYALALELRDAGFVNLRWTLDGAARWSAAGFPLRQWRAEAADAFGVRAFHKLGSRRGGK